MHEFVRGELSLGNLARRRLTLAMLDRLDGISTARSSEVMELVEENKLFGRGIGWVDVHLLASLRLRADVRLWTRDKRLYRAAEDLGFAVSGLH